ncbi:MAG TPA: ArsI/CadI family heavy metal resistance metalloenzyme [Candidatus Nitrosotalea sp.]|nr:ArsI/CadI family heavy metal resistance metalloenzyme [Candidatus Nitrosotalea sp.]
MHVSLATTSLGDSIAFYSTLLDSEPARAESDYALFVTEDPPLELALGLRGDVEPAAGTHYGIAVESARDVERAILRLGAAGLATAVEREETCCYANQTKVWASDPDGRRWEVYTVHAEAEHRDEAACCMT